MRLLAMALASMALAGCMTPRTGPPAEYRYVLLGPEACRSSA